jgi:hypothetical protein
MFVFFKGTVEGHLMNIHLNRWCKFLWSTSDVCKCEILGSYYGEYEDTSSGMLCVLCNVLEIGQGIKSS